MPVLGHPPSVINSGLFKLPSELRNDVYELVCHVDDGYTITKDQGVPEPGLLRTCKIIRREALHAFYTRNNITVKIDSFDCAPVCLVIRKLGSLRKERSWNLPRTVRIMNIYIGNLHWHNLLEWLRRYHCLMVERYTSERHNLYPAYISKLERAQEELLKAMFKMTGTMKKVPWEVVKEALKHFRQSLAVLDAGWGVDRTPAVPGH